MASPLPLLFLLIGCPGPADTGDDGVFMGADPAVPAAPGEARAGVIRDGSDGEAALFGGISAEGRAGDIKIYNSEVQFIIQGPYESHGYVPTGGGIIDADLVRDDDQLGRDLVEDVYLAFSMSRLFHADSVVVITEGSDGTDAIVQATGTDVPWAWFQGMFERDEPVVDELGLEITTTYTLAPDSDTLRISTEIVNPDEDPVEISPQEGAWMSGEDLIPWSYGTGYDDDDSDVRTVLTMTGRHGEAVLSLWRDDGSATYGTGVITSLAAEYGMILAELGIEELNQGQSVTYDRALTISADPSSALGAKATTSGESTGEVCGAVEDTAGPVAGARVHLVSSATAATVGGWALTDDDGAFCAKLRTGAYTAYAVGHSDLEHVQLPNGRGRMAPFAADSVNEPVLELFRGEREAEAPAWATGHPASQGIGFDLTDTDSSAEITLELGQPGRLELQLEDDQGTALPGVLELRWSAGTPPESAVPEALRDALGVPTSSRAGGAWTADGTITMDVLPGTYNLIASHDWRHEKALQNEIEVVAGETTTLTMTMDRVLERQGWLALDSHLHGAPSFDGALPMADRLVACTAVGVDLAAITDHDVHVDYAPLVEALGLSDRLRSYAGVEVTTMLRGHFNIYTQVPDDRTVRNGGALAWWDLRVSTEELFDQMRQAVEPDALLQINHPRTPGMLTFSGYDPGTGEASDPDAFSWDFEVFELLNGGVEDLHEVRQDWFSFLNLGHTPTPLGVSDSHYRFIPCGLGRTDVYLERDEPADVTWDDLREALLAGHIVVASGTTLRVQAGDALPGDAVSGETIALEVAVSAPSWIAPGSLRVYRNGEVVWEQDLAEADSQGLWFDDTIHLESDADAWFVVEVEGDQSLGDAWRNHTPYAISNALFLDVDGDGWEAPGL